MLEYLADLTKGLLIGVSIAAPVGPIGILCMRTTLAQGMGAGFVTGLGAATADALYAALGAFGVSAITLILQSAGSYLRVAGIAVLLWISWGTWRQKPATADFASTTKAPPSLWVAFVTTCGLTLTNPMTILSFAAIFAGAGLASTEGSVSLHAVTLVIGTFVGSLAWWLFLSASVAALRSKISLGALALINKTSAAVLVGFAIWMALQAM